MLRSHIPSAAKHKKMSKVDTLRHAVEYIQSLNRMLNRGENEEFSSTEDDIKMEHPISPPPENSLVEFSPENSTNYESGYDTSSYYSCNSMISPVPGFMYNNSEQTNLPAKNTQNYQFQNGFVHFEPNSEEDELLDAIANWQDS